ncbi:unnamed protein product [Schistocephalus solidus]|uniref:Bestrophin homolog n=1 Tax=Schistocephalus solidus TaxID=70667 RepID=A0A183SGV3_SCHSO|nr:unnamed protein product [Schistocephalus solidus]
MAKEEMKLYLASIDDCNYGVYFLPLVWAEDLVTEMYKEGTITSKRAVDYLLQELLSGRTSLATLYAYDMLTVPLVYTQVCTITVYAYLAFALFAWQMLDPALNLSPIRIDIYVPVFGLLRLIFYTGWLKVALTLLNPFGEDADDFELDAILERNFQERQHLHDHRIHPASSTPVPIAVTNTTCPSPTTSVTTSDYQPPATSTLITKPSTRDGNPVLTCPHCERIFTSHIGSVGHLQIYRTETDKLVPGAPTASRDRHLQFPHCPRAFTHRMGLIGRMRMHVSGIHADTDTSCAPINTSYSVTANSICRAPADSEPADLSCSHWHRTCTSCIGLVGHLRINRTKSGEPVPRAPTYTRHTRLNCLKCPRTFTHRTGLLGHMRIHDNLRLSTAGYTTTLHLSPSASAPHMIPRDNTKHMISVRLTD